MSPSNRWFLGGILLLPGLLIAFSLQIFGQGSPSPAALDINKMPPTSAGHTGLDVSGHHSEWAMSLSPSAVTTKDDVELGSAAGQLILQLQKFRFRRDEKVLARVSFNFSQGRLPEGYDFNVSLATQQGNTILDITPEWTLEPEQIHGLVSMSPEADWPSKLEVIATLRVGNQPAHSSKIQLELFSPKIIVTGVSSPYLESENWVIPVDITVNEPGVAVVSARLTEDNGTLVTHLQSRNRLVEDGALLMHVRRQLISERLYQQNLMLSDITVRHIADGLNAELGWGDSTRATYVLPTLQNAMKR